MGKRLHAFWGLACVGLVTTDAGAVDMALTAKLGTLGLGIEGTFGLTEQFNARLGLNKFDYDRTENIADIDYDLDLEWQTITLLADWYPFGNPFRFTAGLMSNGNELNGSSTSSGLTIGNTFYPGIGLDTNLDFDSTAPYLGVGWGNALSANSGWGFNVDVGIMFQGSGNVTLTPTGPAVALVNPADIAVEEQNFEDDIKDYKYYPVFSFGVSYKF
jgi:hypothetical protein